MNSDSTKYWTAFYTKPRNEKKVAERLSDRGFEMYCPTRTVLKQWSDRKKKVKEPLFTSYVFAHITELERQEVLHDQGIVNSVFWLGKPVVIRNKEINGIINFLNEYPDSEGLNNLVEEGDKIEIMEGPLKGEAGELLKIKGNKLILSIESIGFSLIAEVARSKVKLAS